MIFGYKFESGNIVRIQVLTVVLAYNTSARACSLCRHYNWPL